jgi:hypothetical protein
MAFVSHERWQAADDDDNLHGSPESAIEGGVDPKRQTVSVTRRWTIPAF